MVSTHLHLSNPLIYNLSASSDVICRGEWLEKCTWSSDRGAQTQTMDTIMHLLERLLSAIIYHSLLLSTTHFYYLLLSNEISLSTACHYNFGSWSNNTSVVYCLTRASNLAAKLGRYSLQFISPLPATYIKATIPCYISGTNRENTILIFERHL